MKRILLITVITLLCALTAHVLSGFVVKPVNPNLASIVRLHDMSTDNFFCSGTVVSDKYIITAAHCVAGSCLMPGLCLPGPSEVRVKNSVGDVEIAKVAGVDPIMDQAILSGDFTDWSKSEVETKTEVVVNAMGKHQLMACGFPLGGALYCARISKAVQYVFYFAFDGYIFPGMSGGPVFDLTTGRIVGTNYAAIDNKILAAGTQEEWNSCSVKEKP